MQRHGGTLVHSVRDEYGLIEVVDRGECRSLYFETPIQQSSINLRQPEQLVFEYYRALCIALLFQTAPSKVLILGLGGGALARFLHDALPDAGITSVEFREAVVDVAYEHFQVPVSQRLETWVADAHSFVAQTDQMFSVVFVDLYDALGMSEALSSMAFFDSCRAVMPREGVMAINLWRTDKEGLERVQEVLHQVFGEGVVYLDVDDANTVALVFISEQSQVSAKLLRQRARELESNSMLDLAKYLRRLRRLNGTGYC